MRQPILVRVMPRKDIRADLADASNTAQSAALSPMEQAANDARRVDIAQLAFDEETGAPTP